MAPAPKRPEEPCVEALPTAFSPTTCLRRGLCPVTSLRGQDETVTDRVLESHSLYYELHAPPGVKEGEAKFRVVFIMGLNSSSFAWVPQVNWFTQALQDNPESPGPAEILLFDNRGVGNSGYPRGPYTTSGMAEDAICLLDYIGWTKDRELHVVGISLGGMISQELSYRIPHRIASLTLAVTTPGGHVWQNLPPFSGVRSLARLLFTPDPVQKVPLVLEMLYPPEWLDSKAEGDDKGRTNREIQTEAYLVRVSLTIPQQFVGHISQMAAGLTHRFTPSRLKTIASKIPKITIVTGDVDNLVAPRRSRELVQGMGLTIDAAASKHTNPRDNTPREASEIQRIELVEWKETGHGINHQRAEWFNRLLERTFEEGIRVVEKEKQGGANERVY